MQGRIQREIREKEGLLQDIESVENLKIMPLEHHKKTLVRAEQLTDGQVVYRMTAAALERPAPSDASFTLPDGTVLHQINM